MSEGTLSGPFVYNTKAREYSPGLYKVHITGSVELSSGWRLPQYNPRFGQEAPLVEGLSTGLGIE